MKALVIQAPGETAIADIPMPNSDGGEVLLRVRLVGMCGSDLNTFRGRNPMVTFPRIPGHEIAATIERIRGDPGALRVGMNVTLSPYSSCGVCASCRRGRLNACRDNRTLGVQRDGAMTDFIAAPAVKIYPAEGLELEELCMVEPLTVGFHAAARGRIAAPDSVAVFGCGGVGLGAVAAAAFRGASVIGIDVSEEKLALARQAGAHFTIDSRREHVHQRLLDLTGGHGPDVVIEAIGSPETFRAAVEEVAFTGRVVYIGYAKEPVSYETKLFVQKELDILGARNALPEDFAEVIRMLQQGRFPVKKAIGAIVPLDQAGAALAAWSADPSSMTKIMVRLDSGA